MGSSAALATSLVGALLVWFGVVRLGSGSKNIAEDRRVLHNLAQLAHAVAQGKIGSGFDVAAAVYGTQIYKRFKPEVKKIKTLFAELSIANNMRHNLRQKKNLQFFCALCAFSTLNDIQKYSIIVF